MEDEVDIDLKRKRLSKDRDTSSKKVLKILKTADPYIIFYKLSKIDNRLELDEEIMMKLYQFIRNFNEINFMIQGKFQEFLGKFLKNISTRSVDYHIKCLSYLENIDVEYYRETFGYSKIYQIFVDTIKNIFTIETEKRCIVLLIKLINNNKLAYRNILPILKKLNLFLQEETVEKNIVSCCVVLDAMTEYCREFMDEKFIATLISYFVEILAQPENFIFLDYKDSKVLVNTIGTLCKHPFKSINAKKASFGLLRECIENIKVYSKSSVYEEIMVVVSLTEALTHLLLLSKKSGNQNFDFIDHKVMDFMIIENNKNNSDQNPKTDSKNRKDKNYIGFEEPPKSVKEDGPIFSEDPEGTKNRMDIVFDRPFKHHYNMQFQVLRDDYITNKYIFLDNLPNYTLERIEFYNDLSKIENPVKLFKNIKNLKKFIDWTDMIVFACNAPSKEHYFAIMFDEFYTKNPNHSIYIKMFLKNLTNDLEKNGKTLLYFTKFAIENDQVNLVSSLYLAGINNEDNISKKKREMILRYVNSMGEKPDSASISEKQKNELNDGKKKDIVESEKILIEVEREKVPDSHFYKSLKRITISEIQPESEVLELESPEDEIRHLTSLAIELRNNSQIDEKLQEFTRSMIASPEYKANKNLAMLLIIILSKPIEQQLAIELFVKTLAAIDMNDKHSEDSLICICSLIANINKIEYFGEDKRLKGYPELLAEILSLVATYRSDEYVRLISLQSFEILMKIELEKIAEIQKMYAVDKDNSKYIQRYMKTVNFVINRKQEKPSEDIDGVV